MPPPTGVVSGTFDADQELLERRDGVVGQPVVELVLGGFAGEHLEPGDGAGAAVSLLDGGVEHALAGGPDVRAGAVAADERDDRVGGDVEFAMADGDG
jgi:hypothetical protein